MSVEILTGDNMEGFVYHGSPRGGIEIFKPRESTQKGEFVYATDMFELAGIFGFKMTNLERSICIFSTNTKAPLVFVTERMKDYFKNNDKPVFIYKLDGKDFEYFEENSWGKSEVRTSKAVKPLGIIKFESGLEMLKQFDKEGKIKLFLYPEKPNYIPENDYDLFYCVAKIYAFNPSNPRIFKRMKNNYPHFSDACDALKAKMDKMNEREMMGYAESLYDWKTHQVSEEVYGLMKTTRKENNK